MYPEEHKESFVVPYCVIDLWAGAKDPSGNWRTGWVEGYGPCDQQDRFRNA